MEKRKIDQIRESAGSFDINTPDDETEIEATFTVDNRLMIVKGKNVFEIKLADQIDPQRTNIHTPNTVQKVMSYGAESPWISKTIITANILLRKEILESNINCDEALLRMFNLAEDIAALNDLQKNFHKSQTEATDGYDLKIRENRSVIIPSMNNVEVRCNEFFQKADHALAELFKIVRIFFPDVNKGGWDSLQKKIKDGPENIDNFLEFLNNVLPLLHLIRGARNCVEHPKENQKLVATDFSVGLYNELLPPMIEIVYPKAPLKKSPIVDVFNFVSTELVNIVELMLVFLCARNIKHTSGVPIQVTKLPDDLKKYKHVDYGYTLNIGGQVVPMS